MVAERFDSAPSSSLKQKHMNQSPMNQIIKWAKVLTSDAYVILLDKVIEKNKTINQDYHSPSDEVSAEDIDNMVFDIINNK